MDKNYSEDQMKEPEVYLSWSSPSRLFKKRDTEFYKTIGAIVFLLTIILVFASEFVLVLAMLSIVFLVYVLSTVPPENVDHKITNLGMESAGHYYRWEELIEFWFEEQWGQGLLVLKPQLGPRIVILLGGEKKEKVRELLAKHIPFREVPEKTWMDNASSWLSSKVPLEQSSSH
jgi:hypothetical protein